MLDHGYWTRHGHCDGHDYRSPNDLWSIKMNARGRQRCVLVSTYELLGGWTSTG